MPTPSFHIRDLPIYGDTVLSPMAAYSDVPFRAICRHFGAALHTTEFVPTEALIGDPNPLWRFAMAFSLFRTAAIQQGVYARALQGNATSSDAVQFEDCARRVARAGAALID